jgi:UDP:flavonoid glycosyltransferase YjiC (YdhE family)
MRFLFATAPYTGHFYPLVPLAWAASAAGHDVLVASLPAFAQTITRAGLTALPVGPGIDPFTFLAKSREPDAARGPGRPAPQRGMAGFRLAAERLAGLMAADAVDFTGSWRPDVVVYEPMALLGPLLARIAGAPAVRHLWTMDFTASAREFARDIDGTLATGYGFDRLAANGDLTLDPCPPRLQAADGLRRQPIRYVPYNGRATVPAWLRTRPSRPRVCVTWGTTLGHLGRMGHVPDVVQALGGLDCEVIVAVLAEHCKLFTGLPPNVAHVGPVALDLLLPTCSAIIHQGGGGTTMTALVHGVPQVIIPSLPDQAFNAAQLAATGAANHAPIGELPGPDVILARAQAVLADPRYRQAASELRAELRAAPAPAQVVNVLELVAGAFRARSRAEPWS